MENSSMAPESGSAFINTVVTIVRACTPTGAGTLPATGNGPCSVSVPLGEVMSTPPVPLNIHAPPLAFTPGLSRAVQKSGALPTSVRLPAVKRCAVNGHAAVDRAIPGGSGGLGGGLGGLGGGEGKGGDGEGGLGGLGGGAVAGHCVASLFSKVFVTALPSVE